MADLPSTDIPRREPPGLLMRASAWLVRWRWPLFAAAGLMSVLVLAGRLGVAEAMLAFAFLGGAILIGSREVVAESATGVPVTGEIPALSPSTRQFADAIGDPCFVLDRRGDLRHTNSPARQAFPALRLDNPLALSIRNPNLLALVEGAISSAADATGIVALGQPSETWYRVSVSPLRHADADGAPDLFLVLFADQTEQRRLDRMRADFVANASHELRTPLASLMGFVDTLSGPAENDPDARRKFLGIMRSQAERMANLVDDLLSLSRIELRQHMRPTGRVDLVGCLKEVAELSAVRAAEAGVEFSFVTEDGLPEAIGERGELLQVFDNLVDNALKYGAEGDRIELGVTRKGARSGTGIVAWVKDFGPGVSAENVPRLTERFFRVDVESSRRKKGTGLGLAIVKHIVNRHRGELAIESRPGEGTKVSVHLPV